MKCASCERGMRKGKIRRALVLDSEGQVRSGLVCARCALRALAFVVPPPVTIAPLCIGCKRDRAAVCAHCHTTMAAQNQELLKANLVLAHKLNQLADEDEARKLSLVEKSN
jgi:hypothetical protein